MNKVNYEVKNTLGMFDFLKGCIMLVVILSHTYGLLDFLDGKYTYSEQVAKISAPIYFLVILLFIFGQAMMPMMFILSGYGFRKASFVKLLKKQSRMLLIPYIITIAIISCMTYIVLYLKYGGLRYQIVVTIKEFIKFIIYPNETSPIWFLLSLAISTIIFNQLLHYFSEKKLLVASIIVSVAGWALSFIPKIPFTISQSFVAVLFIYIGYIAKKKKFFLRQFSTKKKVMLSVIIILFSLGAQALGQDLNIAYNTYGLGYFSIIAIIPVSILSIYLFLELNRFSGRFISSIRKLGRYSLYVLCIHSVIWKPVGEEAEIMFSERWTGSLMLRTIIMFVVTAVVVAICTGIFVKVKQNIRLTSQIQK